MALARYFIAEQLQPDLGFPKKKAQQTVQSLLERIKQTLGSGEAVPVGGFGRFSVRDKRERKGRNPAIGQDMMQRSRKVVTFKCSGKLRDMINA